MAKSKPFFFFSIAFTIFFSILFIIIGLEKQNKQLSSSLMIELNQLKSKVSYLESSIKESNRELQKKEDDIARMEIIILEKVETIASLKDKIDSVQLKGSADAEGPKNAPHYQVAELEEQLQKVNSEQNTRIQKSDQALQVEEEAMKTKMEVNLEEFTEEYQGWLPPWLAGNVNNFQSFIRDQWNNSWRPALDASLQKILKKMSQGLKDVDMYIEMVKTERIPVMKNQLLTFISFFEPHFKYLTFETVEAYHASKNSLLSHAIKIQRSATPFVKEWIPVMKNQFLASIYSSKPHFEFLTAETIKAYHAVVKLQRSATPFFQELLKFAQPYVNQIVSVTVLCLYKALVSLEALIKKIIMFLDTL